MSIAATVVLTLGSGSNATAGATVRLDASTANVKSAASGVAAYWTQARMKAANERNAMVVHHPANETPDDNNIQYAQQTAATVWKQQWWAVPAQVGKLYFDDENGNPFQCSATVVAVNVVLTAGHCVVTAGVTNSVIRWHSNYMFIPGLWGTSTPYGVWSALSQTAQNPYIYYGNAAMDYAFLKMDTSFGEDVGTKVGWMGLSINVSSYPSGVWSLGYPSSGYFSTWGGIYPWGCFSPYAGYDTIQTSDLTSGYQIYMGCGSTGGASGGPMIVPINGSWNYVASLNSQCWASWPQTDPNEASCKTVYAENVWGPWFDQRTLALFNSIAQS